MLRSGKRGGAVQKKRGLQILSVDMEVHAINVALLAIG